MCSRDNSRFTQDTARLTMEFSRGRTPGSSSAGSDAGIVENMEGVGEDGDDAAWDGSAVAGGAPGGGVGMLASSFVSDSGLAGNTPRKASGQGFGTRPVTVSRFMPTSRRIVQFSEGKTAPAGARVVYIDGAFDLFHVGHVEILKAARAQGDFLLVGVHTDEEVTERRGPHLPIMGLHERALSVLACRYADEVIIGESFFFSF